MSDDIIIFSCNVVIRQRARN